MDDLLLGYLLDALDPAEKAAVEAHLRDHPEAGAKLDRLRRVLAPLEADRTGYEPPPGLAVATLARVAAHVVAERPGGPPAAPGPGADAPGSPDDAGPPVTPAAVDGPVFPVHRRIEAVLLAGIAFLVVGLVLGGVQKVRRDNQLADCRNNLRVLYQGLTEYADTRDGKFPQVGGPAAPTAGAFVAVLVEAGHCPGELKLVCPAAADVPPAVAEFRPDPLAPPGRGVLSQVGYVYTLGYRGPDGLLLGVRRDPDADGYTPLAADLPARRVAPSAGPVSPHGAGQNVLYADGRVMFVTTAAVGPSGDDIYRNDAGRVRAGLHRFDASLGRAIDEP